jgi:UDP-N-acetylglucosamine 1-carboxyvinyltransferase
MSRLVIKGGKPLKGVVRLGGAKNSSYKLMIAALLSSEETRLLNFSRIADVDIVKKILGSLGATVYSAGERTMFIRASEKLKTKVPDNLGLASRASAMFLAPLLARQGKAEIPLPGGDQIGKRPLDRHFAGLKAMGATFEFRPNGVVARCERFVGCDYHFAKNSHTGTEAMIMAAVLAQGKTKLTNAATEPEVDDLISLLNKMGGKIKRSAVKTIEIEGVDKLGPAIFKVMPDRNEAVSYAIAALVTKGEVIIENANETHITAFLDRVKAAGGGYETSDYGIRFYYHQPLRAVDITTAPDPGFMTDWQPLWSVLATQCQGKSKIIETVFTSRFQFVPDLIAMGAKIDWFDPKPKNPDKFYNFNLKDDEPNNHHGIIVTGPAPLRGGKFKVWDIRAGATLALAGLAASGETILEQAELINRGYEDFAGRLAHLGADILVK